MDDFNLVRDLCLLLKKNGCNSIKVRPHPSMGLWHQDWFTSNGIYFSIPTIESPGDYLSTLKLQIANMSGIHLDAIMLKTPTVFYQLSVSPIADIFHFVERKVVISANEKNIMNYINDPAVVIPNDKAVRYFISSYQTKIEYNVGEFIASFIDYVLDANNKVEIALEKMSHALGNEIKVLRF